MRWTKTSKTSSLKWASKPASTQDPREETILSQCQLKKPSLECPERINNIIILLGFSNHSSNSLVVILEVSWDFSSSSIISGDSMDSRLFDSKSIFSILVIFALFQVLSDVKGLLDEVVEVLRDFGSKTFLSEHSLDFLSSQESDLRYRVVVSEDDTDLALGVTLLSEFKDELFDILNTEISDGEVFMAVW
jgi:hypothetical protein